MESNIAGLYDLDKVLGEIPDTYYINYIFCQKCYILENIFWEILNSFYFVHTSKLLSCV